MTRSSSHIWRSALVLLLSLSLVLQGCSLPAAKEDGTTQGAVEFSGMEDPEFQAYLKQSVYEQVIESLDSEEYLVGDVEVKYVSKEYLEELAYNSQENIYFGYTLSELDELYEGKRYVFTAEDGKTVTQAFDSVEDARFNEVVENIAVGGGVILVCVTIAAVSAPAAPAMSTFFAASAQGAIALSASGAAMSALSAGVAKQIETGDFGAALEEAVYAGSEGFKIGAIAGAVAGGANKAVALKSMTKNGLSLNQAAKIQKESKWPASIVREIKNLDEYDIYKNANLKAIKIGGRDVLLPDIDFKKKIMGSDGIKRTNLERILEGSTPLDPDGVPYQVHHVAQNPDGVFAVLTERQHIGNNGVLNTPGKPAVPKGSLFQKQKQELWRGLGELAMQGLI